MAEASSSRATAIDLEDEEQHEKLEMQIWQACVQSKQLDQLWFQDDLLKLDVMQGKDVTILLPCINKLVGQCMFRAMESRDSRQCWKPIALSIASQMRKLTDTERLVYLELENSGEEGMWTKSIQSRTGITSAEVLNALKKLEGKKLIKQFKSSKHSNKKVYILSNFQPSEDATGGLFYSDGVVDTALLGILMRWTEVYVHRQAWQMSEKMSESGKRKRKDSENPEDPGILAGSKRWKGVKPWPAGYQDYAKAGDVAKYLNKASILYKDKIMEAEAQQILDLLCYDGRIEEVDEGLGYRSILRPLVNRMENSVESNRNGLGEVPCGGCPASGLCDESGPVNARTCEYFERWL